MNTVRPRCFGTSQFVRARHSPQSDHHAPVVHTFEPLSTHSSPSRTAVVSAPATSEPPLGSERNCIQISSPLQDGGDVRQLLLLGAEVEQHRGARRECRHLDAARVLVAGQLLVEDPLVRRGEALAAVLGRDADAGEAGVEEHALHARGRGRPSASSSSSVRRCGGCRRAAPGIGGLRLALDEAAGPGRKRSRSSIVVAHAACLLASATRSAMPPAVLGRGAVQRPVDGVRAAGTGAGRARR